MERLIRQWEFMLEWERQILACAYDGPVDEWAIEPDDDAERILGYYRMRT